MLKTRRVPAMHSPLTPLGKGRRGRAFPSVPSHASAGEETKEQAKARLQEIESIRDHLRRQARKADSFNAGEASRALAPASTSTEPNASSLQRPPVSIPTTMRRPSLHCDAVFLTYQYSSSLSTCTECKIPAWPTFYRKLYSTS